MAEDELSKEKFNSLPEEPTEKVTIPQSEKKFIRMYGHARCGGIWEPRIMNPRACPRCKRYFTYKDNDRPIIVNVPIEYVKQQKQRFVEVKPFALPEVAKVICEKCGDEISIGANVEGKILCANCTLETIQSAEPEQPMWRDLLEQEE